MSCDFDDRTWPSLYLQSILAKSKRKMEKYVWWYRADNLSTDGRANMQTVSAGDINPPSFGQGIATNIYVCFLWNRANMLQNWCVTMLPQSEFCWFYPTNKSISKSYFTHTYSPETMASVSHIRHANILSWLSRRNFKIYLKHFPGTATYAMFIYVHCSPDAISKYI